MGNTEVWYKSVESNTGSPIFEQELEFILSVGGAKKENIPRMNFEIK